MTSDRDERADADRVFIRSKWGTNRYVYNPDNPVGRALIVGSLLFAAGGMWLLYHSGGPGSWGGDDLRSAVTTATGELSKEALLGPGSGDYDAILRERIARDGNGPEDALSVTLASPEPESMMFTGGPEQARYSVTAHGTDTAFCLDVQGMKRKAQMGYDSLTITVTDGACTTH
ncbi:hypothetical protein [Streptomyces sp. NPDC002676]